jgi:nucleoside-diphosphate-sugar epimerase
LNLVTGATGIIGSHVVLELLKRGQPVVACHQKNSDLEKVRKLFSYYGPENDHLFAKIKWVLVDVRDVFSIEETLEGISTVYHCAGFVSFNKKDKKKLTVLNETGTANVVTACLTKKNVALCHVSSIGVINNLDHTEALHEGVFWKTSGKESDYAISKYNAERQVWRGIEEGLEAIIVNPGVVLSPGFWDQSSSRLFETCYKGSPFYTNGTTGYVAASDVAACMIDLMEMRLYANRYILVENNYSFRHIFNLIHKNFGKPEPAYEASKALLQVGKWFYGFVSFFTARDPKITAALINSAFNKQTYSNAKVKQALNRPFKAIDETIALICKSYLNEKR